MSNAVEGAASAESATNGATEKSESAKRSEYTYPYYSLEESLTVAKAVGKLGGSDVKDEQLAKEIDREATSRFFSYYVSSAREFGLIARVGRGDSARIQLTQLGRSAIVKIDDATTRADRMAAFLSPKLYSKLAEQYRGIELPDDDGLATLLGLKYGLVEGVKKQAAQAFRESARFAGFLTPDGRLDLGITAPKKEEQTIKQPPPPPVDRRDGEEQTITVPPDYIVYRCKIAKGRFIEIALPPDFTSAEATRLHNFLLTQVDDDGAIEVKVKTKAE